MKSPIVYFDTAVFIGLLDNVNGRQSTALDWEVVTITGEPSFQFTTVELIRDETNS